MPANILNPQYDDREMQVPEEMAAELAAQTKPKPEIDEEALLDMQIAAEKAKLMTKQKSLPQRVDAENYNTAMKLKQYAAQYEADREKLLNYMQQYGKKDNDRVDVTPLAAWAAGQTGNRGILEAAKQFAPESDTDRARKIIEYQKQLTDMGAEQVKNLLTQQGYEAQRATELEKARIGAASRGSLDDVRFENQVQKYQKATEGKKALDSALDNVETYLGFKLDEYDPSTGLAAGKKIDLPGKNVPGVGRISFYSPEGRRLDSSIARIFNIELRDRSGAAVTNPELDRLKEEFSAGKFQTEEEKVEAIKNYKDLLQAEMARREAAFSPKVRKTYNQRLTELDANQAPEAPKAHTGTGPGGRMSFDEWKSSRRK